MKMKKRLLHFVSAALISLMMAAPAMAVDQSAKLLVCKLSAKSYLDYVLQTETLLDVDGGSLFEVHKGFQRLMKKGICFKVLGRLFSDQLKDDIQYRQEKHILWLYEHLGTVAASDVCGEFKQCLVLRYRFIYRARVDTYPTWWPAFPQAIFYYPSTMTIKRTNVLLFLLRQRS